ncbi:enhancer of mRNA-decapping protein 4-like, partial [Scleropages formosus]
GASAERQKAPFNGDLNGLFGADAPSGGERAAPADSTARGVDVGARDRQIICLTGDDSSTSIAIFGSNVEIVASHDSSINSKARGSNRVKIQPVAKYDWEHKYYHGNLIAVSNLHLAYTIRGANSYAMIRVLSLGTAERTLLKGFTGAVTDLAFAHLDSNQLACLDEAGNLFVWLLTSHGGKIQYPLKASLTDTEKVVESKQRAQTMWYTKFLCSSLMLSFRDEIVVYIQRPADTPLNLNRRLIWCPFIPEDNEENPEDACQTLALLHEDRAEVWDLDILIANNSSWPADATDLNDGFVTVRGHQAPISEGALSPDGAVLATASHDGYVKFWQIYIEGQDHPRFSVYYAILFSCLIANVDPDSLSLCLHEWKPHSGRPLSCLLFCDNHKKQDPDVPFWRFLITGADQNRELKMWCTVSWSCLQTVRLAHVKDLFSLRFSPDHFSPSVMPTLKASLDLSAEFLILSDVQRKVLYVMELVQDQEKGMAAFTAISEFLLTHPVLSFGIQDVSRGRMRHTEVLPPDEESESTTNEGSHGALEAKADQTIQIKLYCIHTKSLQDVQVCFQPYLGTADVTPHDNSQASYGYVDHLAETGIEGLCSDKGSHFDSQNDLQRIPSLPTSVDFLSPVDDAKPKLMTPDAFMTPTASPDPSNPYEPHSWQLQWQASPTRERSPDVISSASTVLPQDIPEIASETLPRDPTLHADCMVSAASALHMLSPRTPRGSEHSAGTGVGGLEGERIGSTPSLLEAALSQENTGVCSESSSSQPWPAAPDITRETRSSLRDNNLSDCSHKEMKEKHKASLYHRHSYSLTQNDSQDASAEQSDHDDEVTSLASSSVNCASKSSRRLQVKDWKVSPRSSPKLKRKSKKDDGDYSQYRQIDQKFAQLDSDLQEELILLLRGQQQDIAELRQSQLEVLQRFVAHLDTMQRSIVDHVEHVMAAQQERDQQRMQHMVSAEQDHSRQLQEQLSQQLAHSLTTSVSNRLDKLFRDELRKTLPQTISRSLEPLTGQLSSTIGAKLTAVEGMLKENVIKVVKSKNTMDTIGRAAAEAIQGPIHAAYKDTFQGVVLPTFEKGCQSMFLQINDSFRQGTNEYIQQLESHTKSRKQREQEPRNHLIGQLQTLIDTLQTSIDQLAASITSSVRSEVQHQLHMVVGNLQDSILAQVQQAVKGEVTMAMKEQQAAVTSSIMQAMRSAAGTPIPSAHLDYQVQQTSILQLLQQGHINQAFQQALSAADLNLVLYVCETVDSQQVFGQQPCPLIQPVLLSLIQQLSTNLTTRSELKISYLEDALMNLDHTNPVTQDHMSSVLSQLRQKLFQFLQLDPHGRLHKRARRLLLMLQGLVSR